MRKHYDFSKEVLVVLEDGNELKLKDISDVWTDDSEKFVHFKHWFDEEVATVNYSKMLYFKPI